MAEAEPGLAEELPEIGEEPVEAPEARVSLTNIAGTVYRAHRFGVYALFEKDGESEIGVLFPGKSFINSTMLLGDSVKTDQELGLLFPPGMPVYMDLASQVSRLVPESGISPGLGSRAESGEKAEERKCSWVIMMLWFGGLEDKPNQNNITEKAQFSDQGTSFRARIAWVGERVMQCDPDTKRSGEATNFWCDSWFVTTIMMPRPNTALAHPDSAVCHGTEGVITALRPPHGGVVTCGHTEVFFHRSRVYLEGRHLSVTLDLSKVLKLGMKVTVDYSPNEQTEGAVFEDCPTSCVALLLYTGPRPEVSLLRHQPFPLAEDEKNKYLVAKIVKFDPPGPTGVESGIAEVLRPTDLNTLAFTKNSFKRTLWRESRCPGAST